LAKLKYVNEGDFKSITFSILFDPKQGVKGLESVMDDICAKADQAIASGTNIIFCPIAE
jgi:glutamate synthase (ferredoxin)